MSDDVWLHGLVDPGWRDEYERYVTQIEAWARAGPWFPKTTGGGTPTCAEEGPDPPVEL